MPLRRYTRIGGLAPHVGYLGNGDQSSKPKVHTDSLETWPTRAPAVNGVDRRTEDRTKHGLEKALERTFGETSSLTTKTQDKNNTYFPCEVEHPSSDRGNMAAGFCSMTPKANPAVATSRSFRMTSAAGKASSAYLHTDADPEMADPLRDLRDIQHVIMSTKRMIRYKLLAGIHRVQWHLEKRVD